MSLRRDVLVALTVCLLVAPVVFADDDPDGAQVSSSKVRVLPVPIFLTEPAIGRGLGVSLMLIHPRADTRTPVTQVEMPDASVAVADGAQRPPDVTAVFGAYTDADSWVAGIAHSASWRRDRTRYLGALMQSNMNARVYATDLPLGFSSHGTLLLQKVGTRVGRSPFFVAGLLKANRSDTSVSVDLGGDNPLQIGLGETTDVGLAVQGSFDTRDTTFTPSRGQLVNLSVWRHDAAFGGDFDYWKTHVKAVSFHPLTGDVILGLRAEGAAVSGDPPFWGYPWITLRGIPAMRYQDERVLTAEAELRWNVLPRWAVVGFFGGGATRGDLAPFESQQHVYAGGAGVRFLFAADLGLWVGADIARGPEDDVWYIQVGHAW